MMMDAESGEDNHKEIPPSGEIEVQELLSPAIVSDNEIITHVSPWQVFCKMLSLALPMGASYTFGFNIVLMGILIGYLKDTNGDKNDNLGAAALIGSLMYMLGLISVGTLYSISITAGKKRGRLNQLIQLNIESEYSEIIPEIAEIKAEISTLPRNGMLMCAASLPLVMTIVYHSKSFLMMLGQNPDTAGIAQTYLRPAMSIFPLLTMRMCFEQILFGFEKQKPAMIIGLTNFGIGAFLSTSMCFGYFSFPELRIPGIAYGFIVESFLTCLGFGLYLGCHRDFKNYHFFSHFKITRKDGRQIKNLLKIGLPILFTLIVEALGELLVSLFCGWLGRDEIAARNFSALFITFVTLPLISFGQANCQEVSRLIGGKHFQRAMQFARYGLLSSLAIMFPLSLIVSISPGLLTSSVANTEDVNSTVLFLAKRAMPIVATGMLFDAARYNKLQVLRAADDHIIPTAISAATQSMGVILSYFLGLTGLKFYGLLLGDALGKALGSLALFPRWYKKLQPTALAVKENLVKSAIPRESYSCLKFSSLFRWSNYYKSDRQPLLEDSKEKQAIVLD